MVVITSQEIALFRSELAAYSQALKALDEIEDCEGNIEDAAISLAIQAGQEPNISENWLDGLAKRCRVAICKSEIKEELINGRLNAAFGDLLAAKVCPDILITAVIIYVFKTGVNEFCEPLDYKL
ncbi:MULTISPECIES: hypothetical protein [Microcoleus]|jgi:hypothetical protein|uniref:Uncharacterized protein n=1 Tax=Microcoleus anatoxicus PTRS2 TaxID=2705321 RepID=A0ABU8YRG2_9CYAN|nr:MAG: hypothetical protein EA000_25710 [Oscillatoriales cyanobacterium]TAD92593.1 MAG: hypothetical protein EAZ98_25545 [Oscillatoriales cyanobacterium]TAE03712.1 MAG: hypothetical protein EAZ96_12050 [Oscillatoriales cyanobacterium]TAF00789.1 MAG: hypothetical protein EAZ78_19690 [Oscillatoriales cyanobacterium]TAF70553.1 MAG: hypothetical protein EAZ59_04275 [Oscillatoriales cyanobacterium]